MAKANRESFETARNLTLKLMQKIDDSVDKGAETSIADLMAACEASCNLSKALIELENIIANFC